MKIVYLTRMNFFSEKAHVHTITKTCEALAQEVSLTLVGTDNSLLTEEKKDTFFKLHHVVHPFPIVSLDSSANYFKESPYFLVFNLSTLLANISFISFLFQKRKTYDVVYFRDHLILPAILFAKYILGKKIVYESHYILTKSFGQWLTERSASVSDGVVSITGALKAYYMRFNRHGIVSFCTSSDAENFIGVTPKEKKSGEFRLVYTGNIDVTGNGDSYGVEDIVNALPYMPDNVCLYAVGKKTTGVHRLEQLASELGVSSKLILVPWVTRDEVVRYILSADVLIIPSSGAQPGNSPTKMFEYLGAGRPIVAANTGVIAEVLHDKSNALLVEYKKPQSWADAVQLLMANKVLSDDLVEQAKKDAGLYTWEKRGKDISLFIQSLYA